MALAANQGERYQKTCASPIDVIESQYDLSLTVREVIILETGFEPDLAKMGGLTPSSFYWASNRA